MKLSAHIYHRFIKGYVDDAIEKRLRSQSLEQFFFDVTYSVIYNQVSGDYLEFGVYNGDSFSMIYHYTEMLWKNYQSHIQSNEIDFNNDFFNRMRFFAFDSFEGLPESNREDTPIHYKKEGAYSAPKERFLANLEKKKVNVAKVVTVPGWFDATLKEETKVLYNLTKASLIFIDCDLFESAVPVFNFVTSLIQDGTVMIIDDYFRYKGIPTKGIQKAFKEWLANNPSLGVSELARCSANRVAFICYQL
jgi:O-methyltransferase